MGKKRSIAGVIITLKRVTITDSNVVFTVSSGVSWAVMDASISGLNFMVVIVAKLDSGVRVAGIVMIQRGG